jgi:hypothetical protein
MYGHEHSGWFFHFPESTYRKRHTWFKPCLLLGKIRPLEGLSYSKLDTMTMFGNCIV